MSPVGARFVLAAACLAGLALGTAITLAAERVSPVNTLPRLALVIGNANYPQAPLKNPRNDATATAERLKAIGFDVVLKLDASKNDMDRAIHDFGTRLRERNGVGLFYFAGHGAQINWRNYLIPVDALIKDVAHMQARAVDLSTLLETFEFARNPVNLVILDACRDNPLGNDVRLEQKGLSQVDAPPGTLLAYATAPGNVAADGARQNGLYTEHLLREMQAEARIEDVFKRVRLNVRRESRGRQIPWESTSLEHDLFLVVPAAVPKSALDEADKDFQEEGALWDRARAARDAASVEAYLRRFPSGRFAELAQFRLDQLLARQGEVWVTAAPSRTSAGVNPFTKGTVQTDTSYSIGDVYTHRRLDRASGAAPIDVTTRVTSISEDEVVFNNGILVTDLLGNSLSSLRGGTRDRGRQFYIAEYTVGKRWTTRFGGASAQGKPLVIEYDMKVVSKEAITVPAGTFQAFKVEARGSNNLGHQLEYVYWVAPELVRRPIVYETLFKNQQGKVLQSERNELVSYRQLRAPGATR